jgi:deoxyribonuclease-4
MEPMNLGAHLSIAGGVHRALERAAGLGCHAVQLFVKNTNQWGARRLPREEIRVFKEQKATFAPHFILAHASYLVNLASPDKKVLDRSLGGFLEEMKRAHSLGIPSVVIHPGSHRGSGEEQGLRRVARSLDELLSEMGPGGPTILLETTAGQGDTIGHTFEQLERIIEGVTANEKLGVCFDTCHVFAAGYDLRTKRAYDATLRTFDRVIGIKRLRAFHLNDSARGLGSRVDRHAHIGTGALGLGTFSFLVNDTRFFDRPMILETPKGTDDSNDIRNLAVLRSLRRGPAPRD